MIRVWGLVRWLVKREKQGQNRKGNVWMIVESLKHTQFTKKNSFLTMKVQIAQVQTHTKLQGREKQRCSPS